MNKDANRIIAGAEHKNLFIIVFFVLIGLQLEAIKFETN